MFFPCVQPSLIVLQLITTAVAAKNFKTNGCRLNWTGRYHVSGRETLLRLNETWMDTLGHCIASSAPDGQNYIFRLKLSSGTCDRCVAIFSFHPNILQYKQSRCIKQYKDGDDIEATCRHAFRGDTPMKTLFRNNARSEECPFTAPFEFTYITQDGYCSSRTSAVNSCSESGKFRFHYQACPELANSETHVDELECIAHWYSFGVEFFAVRITNSSVTGPNIIFRCLIHERTVHGGRLGLSADSSCSELTDLTYAGTKIDYIQGTPVKPRCHFPSFLIHEHHNSFNTDSKQQWISMVSGSRHYFSGEEWIDTLNAVNYSVSLCLQLEDLGSAQKIMVHITQHCTAGFQCIKIKKRHKNILEITRGDLMEHAPESCNVFADRTFDTLVLADAQVTQCPVTGQHFDFAICTHHPVAQFGCTETNELIIDHSCNSTSSEKFSCIGYWQEDMVQYIVTKELSSSEFVCYSYSPYPKDGITHIRSYHRTACHTGSLARQQPHHDLTVTKYGDCSAVNEAFRTEVNFAFLFIIYWCHL